MIGIWFHSKNQREAISDLSSVVAVVVSLLLFGCGPSESGRLEGRTLEAGDIHSVAPGDSTRILRTIEGRTYELRSIREWCDSSVSDSALAMLTPSQRETLTPNQRENYIRSNILSCMRSEVRRTEPSLLVIGIPSEIQLIEPDPSSLDSLSRGSVAGSVAGVTGLSGAMVLYTTNNMTFVDYETFARRFRVSTEMQPIVARALQRIVSRPSIRAGFVFVAASGITVAVLYPTRGPSGEPPTRGERGARHNGEIELFKYVLLVDEAEGAPVSSSSQD